MTPYKIGKKVVIDPTIKSSKLHFGEVPATYYKKIGTIVDTKYIHQNTPIGINGVKSDSYEVEFDNGKKFWFLEKEIG